MGRGETNGLGSSDYGRSGLTAFAPIIILEGPDGSGKSTLAKSFDCHYLHARYRFKGKMVLYHLALLKKAVELSKTKMVVIDRWRLSEITYGSVFRDGPEHPEWTEPMFHLAASQGATFVTCLPNDKEKYLEDYRGSLLSSRSKKYKDMTALDPRMANIVEKMGEVYDTYLKTSGLPSAIRYDRFNRPETQAAAIKDAAYVNFYNSGCVQISCKRKRK